MFPFSVLRFSSIISLIIPSFFHSPFLHETIFSHMFYSLDWSPNQDLANILGKMPDCEYFIKEVAGSSVLCGTYRIREKNLHCPLPFSCDGPHEVTGMLCTHLLYPRDNFGMKNKETQSRRRGMWWMRQVRGGTGSHPHQYYSVPQWHLIKVCSSLP